MFKFKVKESENYKFHYLENLLAEKEIDLIIEEQQQVINELQEFFNIKIPLKIYYYLLNSTKQISYYFGQGFKDIACAVLSNKVYDVYNKKMKCIGYQKILI